MGVTQVLTYPCSSRSKAIRGRGDGGLCMYGDCVKKEQSRLQDKSSARVFAALVPGRYDEVM